MSGYRSKSLGERSQPEDIAGYDQEEDSGSKDEGENSQRVHLAAVVL